MYEDQNKQLTAEIHQMREELSKADQHLFQANANSDLQHREIQMLKSQLNQANTLIQQYQETNAALSSTGHDARDQLQRAFHDYRESSAREQQSQPGFATSNNQAVPNIKRAADRDDSPQGRRGAWQQPGPNAQRNQNAQVAWPSQPGGGNSNVAFPSQANRANAGSQLYTR